MDVYKSLQSAGLPIALHPSFTIAKRQMAIFPATKYAEIDAPAIVDAFM